MSAMIFFPKSFLGTSVNFGNDLTWTVFERLGEEVNQQDELSYMTSGSRSRSIAAFLCHDSSNPDEIMTLKIIMQIPYTGTDLETANERQRQATQRLPYCVQYEFDARTKLSACGCYAAPLFHSYKWEEQAIDDMVPGGWAIYMLIQQAPVIPLGGLDDTFKTVFWSLPYSARNDIREAFRAAWEACVEVGILPQEGHLGGLWWDPESKKFHGSALGSSDCGTRRVGDSCFVLNLDFSKYEISRVRFFTPSFLGTIIDFTTPQPLKWTVLEKLSEEVYQQTAYDHKELGAASHYIGLFRCSNSDGPDKMMILKITMQVTCAGTELFPAQERGKQATTAPPIFGVQDETGMVPRWLDNTPTIRASASWFRVLELECFRAGGDEGCISDCMDGPVFVLVFYRK
ncbi:uncharacterized protein ASPGLDRAFT_26482 [Aspergillus glaucus CBS 516.65]|uniref:Uncharacterized protein n=1 Tax=Aspergillus glaucus CBS 516.65 TaxID=1160497 RepID=A0A1L9VI54_ASPGL|nr:hypothetical protein ASPGLDRAFT_26482 [Aspergillus glaucus CBS 516.65]OJJ83599.1 hypothetical protein ASPGLDRAFT_26482 [Aspergillus glaucus CBS 516.65]